ncbi:hypothetical protein E2320_001428, partial [Naja naja]
MIAIKYAVHCLMKMFRPILYGCRLPCCNAEDVREEWPSNSGAVPGYTPAASTSLITNLSSGEESAEDCLEGGRNLQSPGMFADPLRPLLPTSLQPLLVMILMMMLGVVMIIQAVYRGELKDTFLMKIML